MRPKYAAVVGPDKPKCLNFLWSLNILVTTRSARRRPPLDEDVEGNFAPDSSFGKLSPPLGEDSEEGGGPGNFKGKCVHHVVKTLSSHRRLSKQRT